MKPASEMNCSTCRFFMPQPPPKGQEQRGGACRRKPPVVIPTARQSMPAPLQNPSAPSPQIISQVVGTAAAYPLVGEADWCGEYEMAPGVFKSSLS